MTTNTTDYSVDTLTKAYIQLRDERSALKESYESQDGALISKMDKLEAMLMAKLNEFQVDSVKTPYGTVYTQIQTKYTCGDWTNFWAWMLESQRLDAVEKRVGQKAMKEIEAAGEELPPGIEVHRERQVVVRRGQ